MVKSIPSRVFGNDPERISRFYDIDLNHASLLVEIPDLLLDAMSRLDCIHTPGGVKCLEINSGSHLDAWFRSAMAGCQIRDPLLRSFLQSEGVSTRPVRTGTMAYTHFIKGILRSLENAGSTINFVMAMPPSATGYDGVISKQSNAEEYAQALAELGGGYEGSCLTCSYAELALEGSKVMAGGNRIHGLYELSPLPPRLFTNICRASLGGRIMFFSGLATAVLSDKRNLAILSNPGSRKAFSPSEEEFIRRHVPWTRSVSDGEVIFEGKHLQLKDLLLARKDDFVLKRAKSTKRDDIFVGRFTSSEVWDHFVGKALGEGCWIVQEYVANPPLYYQQGSAGACLHELILGCFCIGGHYAGTWLRMDTLGKRGVINAAYGAEEAYLLELEEPMASGPGTATL